MVPPPATLGVVRAAARLHAGWDWTAGFTLIGLGAVAVLGASLGVSESHYVSDQMSFMVSGGLGGLLLLGTGAVLVVTAGLADEWRKLDRLTALLPGARPDRHAGALARQARLCAAVGIGTAAVFLLSAWSDVSNESDPERGFEALGLGGVGLLIGFGVCAASTLWLHRRVAGRRDTIFARWDAPVAVAPAVVAGGLSSIRDRVVVATGLKRYHRPGCPAVKGLDTREIDRHQLPGGLEPCELCESN
jgi:hypothetical protein